MPDQEPNIFAAATVEEKSPFNLERLADQFKFKKTDWTIPEAFLGILLAAAYSDGSLSPEEVNEVRSLAQRTRTLKALSPNELAAANANVEKRLKDRPDGLKQACETLPADMCLPVFAHCVDIILSDGELLKPEADFLQSLVPMLDIDPNNARRVMEVLLLKNQY
jgi:uncharacterized tellurite resistance protein B-like protein